MGQNIGSPNPSCDCICPGEPPPGTAKCVIPVTLNGCMVAYYTDSTGEGAYPFLHPYSVNNPQLGATVRMTGGGYDVTQAVVDFTDAQGILRHNTAYFTVYLPIHAVVTLTFTATAANYLDQTITIKVQDCAQGPAFQQPPAVNFAMVRDHLVVFLEIGRCDYPGGAPLTDDGTGTQVNVNGTSKLTDQYGNAEVSLPVTAGTGQLSLTVTASGPAPYYGAWSETQQVRPPSNPSCVFNFIPQTVGAVPLLPGFRCSIVTSKDPNGAGTFFMSKPLPMTLHCTLGGVAVTLTNTGTPDAMTSSWTGCANIKGTVVSVIYVAGYNNINQGLNGPALTVQFLSQDWGNSRNDGSVWKNGWCTPKGGGAPYQPTCPTAYCLPGDSAGTVGFFYYSLTGSTVIDWQPSVRGMCLTPYNGTGFFSPSGNNASYTGAGGAGTGCPWAGPCSVVE